MMRQDKYLLEVTANMPLGQEVDARIKFELTLAGLQDMIGEVVEQWPQATSFVFTVVRNVKMIKDQDDQYDLCV